MIKTLQFVPVQITALLILGILVGYYNPTLFFSTLPYILIGLLSILLVQFWHSNRSFTRTLYFNFTTYVLSFFIGVSTITIHHQLNNPNHYSHFISDSNTVVLVIDKKLKSGLYSDKYEALVRNINGEKSIGKILLNVQKDSVAKLKVDDQLYLKSSFNELVAPMNPYYFDYRTYLSCLLYTSPSPRD